MRAKGREGRGERGDWESERKREGRRKGEREGWREGGEEETMRNQWKELPSIQAQLSRFTFIVDDFSETRSAFVEAVSSTGSLNVP